MNKKLHALFNVLTEDEKYDLGDIVFSPQRTDGVSKREPNTHDEQYLYYKIVRWVNSIQRMSREDAEMIRNLMKSPKYGSFFQEIEPGNLLYRGLTNVDPGLLASWLLIENKYDIPESGHTNGNWSIKSIHDSPDSYTLDSSVAREFSKGKYTAPVPGKYKVIFTAKSEDNPGIFFDIDFILQKMRDSASFLESEVLALGPVNVINIRWKLIT